MKFIDDLQIHQIEKYAWFKDQYYNPMKLSILIMRL